MRAKLNLLSTLVLGTLGGVLAGCQTYDFEPVEPLAISQTTETRIIAAREAKPNLMLLVDTSGSMTDPTNPDLQDSSGNYVCRRSGKTGTICGDTFACDTTVCPTRWSELQSAMKDFLTSSATIARIGLSTFPDTSKGDSCGASSSLSVPLPPADTDDETTLSANADLVKTKLLAIKNSSSTGEPVPSGGTPTSASLQYMGTLPELQTTDRSDFILLLTDGLPNCNSAFPKPSPDPACFCTLSDCSYAKQIGCLDSDASVSAVTALRTKEIKTIVIGFGTDFAGSSASAVKGTATLNGMAEAGGFARGCTTNADCGSGDTCETAKGLCTRRFYQAGNKAELVAALTLISQIVKVDDPCLLRFDASQRPSSEELVVVYVNGQRLSPGADTWSLTDDGITFTGSTCDSIKASTSGHPANIEVRAVQKR